MKRLPGILAAASLLVLVLPLAGCIQARPAPAAQSPETAGEPETEPAQPAEPAPAAQSPETAGEPETEPAQPAEPTPEQPAEVETVPQTMCPVMDWTIDRHFFTDHQGKRIYFACSVAAKRFRKDPERYMKVLEERGVVLEEAPEQ